MAEITAPVPLELSLTPEPGSETLDQAYSRRRLDDEWAALLREQATTGTGPEVRGEPGKGTEEPAGDVTLPSRAPVTDAALTATLASVKDGILKAVEGLAITGIEPSMTEAKRAFEGLMQTAMSPLAGLAAGGGEALAGISPGLAESEFLAGPPAFTLRHLAMGAPDLATLPPEEVQAMRQPMTAREALELAIQMAPMGIGGAKKVAQTAQIKAPTLLGERGSLKVGPEPPPEPAKASVTGPEAPPAGAAFQGAPAGGGAAPAAAEAAGGAAKPAINPRTLQTPTHIMDTIKELDAHVTERLKSHRARKSHEETVAGARMSLEKALSYTPETAYLTEEGMAAMTMHFENAAEFYDTVKRQYRAGNATPEQLKAAWAVAETLAINEVAAGTNAGRTLNIRGAAERARQVTGKVTPEQILRVGEQLMTEVDADTLASMTDGLTTTEKRSWFRTLAAGQRAGRDLLHELWINNILSGIDTTSRNLFGTTTGIGADIPETLIAEIIRPVREAVAPYTGGIIGTADPAGVQFGETAAKLRAAVRAKADIVRLVQDVNAGKETFGRPTPFDRPSVRSAEYGFDAESPMGRFIDTVDGALNSKLAPLHWLKVQDAVMKGLVYRMEIGGLAVRQATMEGAVGKAFDARVLELEREPLQWMIREAEDQAVLRTLNKELGPGGKMVMGAANRIPFARVVLPFMQTPTNSGKWTFQRLPALSLLSAQNSADLAAGGALADKALSRMAIGNGVAALIAWQVWEGNITGGGHPNKNIKSLEREEKPPYSLRVGNQWVRCDLDPVCGYIRVVADFVEMTQYIPDQAAYAEWAATAEAVGLALGHGFIQTGMLSNLRDALNAMAKPDSDAGKFLVNLSRGIAPTAMRDVARFSDENVIRDVRTLMDGLKTAWPWYINEVPPVRNNITGEPFRRPSGWPENILPLYRYTTKPDDPVMVELARLRVPLEPVPWSIFGPAEKDVQLVESTSDNPGTKLDAQQRDFWIVKMTHEKMNGRTLHESLAAKMRSASYRDAPDATKRLIVRAEYSAYKDMALGMLLDKRTGSPTLMDKVERQMRENAAKFRKTTPAGLAGSLAR